MVFSYYGSKVKLINHYPPPMYDRIIEPFAGSARYALKYWNHDVLLVDKYSVIVDVWTYLISASIKDIQSLPELKRGDPIPSHLLPEEKLLMGFAMNPGSSRPKASYSAWASRDNEISRHKNRILRHLDHIRHWKVMQGDYSDVANQAATWYIDPPYQRQGHYYVHNTIDYRHLSVWCQERKGLTIVCENMGADWLPFTQLTKCAGQRNKNVHEAIWTQHIECVEGLVS